MTAKPFACRFAPRCALAIALSMVAACHSETPVRPILPAPDASIRATAIANIEDLTQQPPGVYASDAYVILIKACPRCTADEPCPACGPAGLTLASQPPIAGQAVGPTIWLEAGGWGLEAFETGARYRITARVDAKGDGTKAAVLVGATSQR